MRKLFTVIAILFAVSGFVGSTVYATTAAAEGRCGSGPGAGCKD